jgi:3-ketosteroid 9alpha-monooxygenase subunit A
MNQGPVAIRDIDTGAVPDRYARGWHCLGPAADFVGDGCREVDIFGTTVTVMSADEGFRLTSRGGSVDGGSEASSATHGAPRLWDSDVRGGLLFAWHDHEGNPPPPAVRIPDIPEFADDGWTTWRWNSIVIEGSNCREIIDNIADMAHFFYIHFGLPTFFKNVFDGHVASQFLHNVGRRDIEGMGTAYADSHLDSEAVYFGPSFMINWLHNNYGGFKAESILINCHYPVTQNSFVLQWGVIVEKPAGLDDATTDKLAAAMTDGVSKGFLQDVEIWKHKTRIDNPLLVEEDGPVYQLRRWYQQFYTDVADITPDMTDRFELEIDTTVANEKWELEVEENLRSRSEASVAGG